ncbi:hypothetical protein Patl1_03889 [Pistacia atlantica]|uniref:Uncharacterized protein n=1 Tax=Pistacia atlantica TaxID=434234 RepID=A0ACC1BRQ8_9ROSI|nr:hypothetical protein Patl1_03889 [Pistacia atlantica]
MRPRYSSVMMVLISHPLLLVQFNRNDCPSQKTQGEGNERGELSKIYSHSIPCINIGHKFVYHPYEEE